MKRSILRVLAIIAALAMMAAACGDDDDSTPAASDDGATASDDSAATPEPDAEEPEPEEPGTDDGTPPTSGVPDDADLDAVLKVVTSIAPQQYDPLTGTFPCDVSELSLIYDTLIREQPDGSFAPGLAASWTAPDDSTFELTLQEGVQFQDGTPFDADALQQHFERALTNPLSSVRELLSFVDGVEAVDDTTVRINLSEPRVGVLPALLTGRAGMVASPTALAEAGETYGSEGAVGAGPYRYVEHIPGEMLRVERWDGYWDPSRQLLGGVEHMGISQQFQIEGIESGELNYAALNDDLLGPAQDAADQGILEVVVDPTTQFMEVFVNFGVEPFDDIRVRQALNHAIDRQAVTDALTEGAGSVAWGPLPPNSRAHNPAVDQLYPFDQDRARELLAEAGFEDGISFEAAVIEIPLYQRTAEVLQDMLAQSGFDITLVPVTGAEVNNRLYVEKDLSAAFTAFNAPSDPGLALEAKYASFGANNPADSTVEGLDELLARGAATTDQDERVEIYREAEQIVMENALGVPIYHFAGIAAFAPAVENVVRGYTACQGANYLSPPIYIQKDGE